jgi:hypothetical protein
MMRKLVLKILDRKTMYSFVLFIFFLFGSVSSNTAQMLSVNKSDVDQEKVRNFEFFLNSAKSASSEYVLDLEKLDISEAKSAYDNLSFEEKDFATEFPFLDSWVVNQLIKLQSQNNRVKVSFIYNIPPEKQSMDSEVWRKMRQTKKLNVVLDGVNVEPETLKTYTEKDFAFFEIVQIKKGGLFRKAMYDITLTSNEKYHRDFVLARKELHTISAKYANGEEMIIPYFMIERTLISDQGGRLVPNYPVNYLSIILEEINKQDFKSLLEKSERLDNAPGLWIYYNKSDEENFKLFVKY